MQLRQQQPHRRSAWRGGAPMPADILLGVVTAVQGLKGEVRVKTFTETPERLGDYGALHTSEGRKLEIAALRAFYRFAESEKLLPLNVAESLSLPRRWQRLPKSLTSPEIDQLLKPQLLEDEGRFFPVIGGEEDEGYIDRVHRVARVPDDLRYRFMGSFVIADG